MNMVNFGVDITSSNEFLQKPFPMNIFLLLQAAYEERDEARDQLQKLMSKFVPSTTATELPALLLFQPESPLNIPTKANSSITESNSLYETYNHQSYGSSPADSFFDGVSSPDFSTANMADSCKMSFVNQPYVTEYNAPQPLATGVDTPKTEKPDPFSAVIDNLVKGKALPQKGKLLQAVTEAGPLLQTLLVAGPLPQWRNPPPLQAFKIPSLLVNGCNTKNINQNLPSKPSSPSPKPLHSLLHTEMFRGSSQICSASSMFSFNSAFLMAPNVNTQILQVLSFHLRVCSLTHRVHRHQFRRLITLAGVRGQFRCSPPYISSFNC